MSAGVFKYKATDAGGKESRGEVEAGTRQQAFRVLAARGLTPLVLQEKQGKAIKQGRRGRVKRSEVAQFTYQLSVLMGAQIPISEGLRSIAEQETNARLAHVVMDIAHRIQSGSTITDAMSMHRALLGDVYVETIRAAEKSGNMIKILEHLAEMLERQTETQQQLRQAMMYPIVVIVALTGATLFLIAFVVPKFAKIFAQRGVDLPLLTRALQVMGESLQSSWWLYGLCALVGFFVLRTIWKTPQGQTALDRIFIRVPYLNKVLNGLAVSRFARVFGISLSSGLGLIESLEMSGRASGRPSMMKDADVMLEQVRQGGKLSDALRTCAYLPGFAKRMISAGEESAELGKMCSIVAKHYDREVGYLTKNAATVIEPILIAGLTGVVLVIALAIFLPMWDMVGLIQ